MPPTPATPPPGSPDSTGSEEFMAPVNGQVEICYQTFGSPDDDPLLLVMGLGGPMIWWDDDFCRQLVAAGFFVIRYDNRDTGRSSRIRRRVRPQQLVQAFTTGRAAAPYSLRDMAADGMAVLDHLGIPAAHVAGISMGGMIVQTMALQMPSRVLSMASIMSTTGRRTVGWQSPRLLPALVTRRRDTKEQYVVSSAAFWALIGSPRYPADPDVSRKRAEDTYDRGVSASGQLRQVLAILTQPDRTSRLRLLRIPTLVIHGRADKMVHVSGGRATAAAVPDAELLLIDGMGHDLPDELFEPFVAAIRRTADRAS